ncbi:hypothetical protein M0P48_01520 [Candidatus Gracilibacteria bacterium]|nr:hypothetical protein [Candidatus Gracilibacteria bacterium]
MFSTSADILNMSLAIGFIILVIFLSITLFYAILILRDFSHVSNEVKTTVQKIHATIAQPLMAIEFIVEKIRPYIEMFIDKKMNGGKVPAKKK